MPRPAWLSSLWTAEPRQQTSTTPSASDKSKHDESDNDDPSSTAPSPVHESLYTSSRIIISSLVLTATLLAASRLYKQYLRRIPSIAHIKPNEFRTRRLHGYVTSVGDGDNFRFYHTPGGRLAGWGWVPGRRKHLLKGSSLPKSVRDGTLHLRIAGVDAPELAHFGRPAQPFGAEALEYLKGLVLGRNVCARIWRRDQYGRIVATVHVRAGYAGLWRRRDVGLEMLRAGMATVYEAKFGSEFGGMEQAYIDAEKRARQNKVGMWAALAAPRSSSGWFGWFGGRQSKNQTELESPRQYKERMKELEASADTTKKT